VTQNPQKTAEKALTSPPNTARIRRCSFLHNQHSTFGSRLLHPEPAPSEPSCLAPPVRPACAAGGRVSAPGLYCAQCADTLAGRSG